MPNDSVVLGGVFILGGITASHVTANKTQAQMHPAIPGFDALLAHVFAGMGDFDLVHVSALDWHTSSCRVLPCEH